MATDRAVNSARSRAILVTVEVRVAVLVVLAGCGRIGFDAAGDDTPPSDAPPELVEAIGELDPTFGAAGTTTTTDTDLDVSAYSVIRRSSGYLAVGVRGDLAGDSAIVLVGYKLDGQPDPAFGVGGMRDVGPTANDFGYGALRLDADRIVVNGDGATGSATRDDFTLGIVDESGAPDSTFGIGGFVRFDVAAMMRDDTANRVAVVGSTIVACGIGGYNVTDSTFALARFDLGGALVPTWGTNGLVADELNPGSQDECFDATALGANVIAVGRSDDDRFVVAAYREVDGSRDPAFATGGLFERIGNNTRALGVTTVDGEIVAVGERNGVGFVLRLDAGGAPVSAFGNAGEVTVTAADSIADVVVQPNGKLILAGTTSSGGVVVRLLSDGTLDPAFGAGGIVPIPRTDGLELQKLALDPDGKIVAVGIAGGAKLGGLIARIR